MAGVRRPNNKSVLKASVRFDSRLSDFDKLLYGELVALCGRNGHCWPRNQHLAELYGKSTKTVSRSIKRLTELGLIRVEINRLQFDRRDIHLAPEAWTPAGGGTDAAVLGAGHPCPTKAATLLIRENNDISNDGGECGTRAQKANSVFDFSCGASPTLGQVRDCMENLPAEAAAGLDLSAEALRFHNHYRSNGWTVGRAPMRDLAAATANWLDKASIFNRRKNHTHDTHSRNFAGKPAFAHLETRAYEGDAF